MTFDNDTEGQSLNSHDEKTSQISDVDKKDLKAMEGLEIKNDLFDSEVLGRMETIENFASNPMMERVQQALHDQLKSTYDRIKQDALEKQQELRKVKKQRENCGVELYGMQQQLARLQNGLDKANADYEGLIDLRKNVEKQTGAIKDEQLEKKRKLENVNQAISKRKVEVDELILSTKQAKLFNQETKNEAVISKQAASKAEESVKELQKSKVNQDYYIDSLCERIKSLEQEAHLSQEQLLIQKKLTIDADKVIEETVADLDALMFEKKQLVQQWDSSIIALGRRDQALSAASNALKNAQYKKKDYQGEVFVLIRETKILDEQRESKVLRRNRIESEIKFLEEEIRRAESDQEKMAEQYEIISKAITTSSTEEAVVEKMVKKLESEILSLTSKMETVARARRELEDQTGVQQHDQKSISQAMVGMIKEEKVLTNKISENEIECAHILNELARLRIDALNTEAHTGRLENRLGDETNKVDEKDVEITRIETEIRRTHTDIEGKMNKVDRLNRKYEQMLDGVEEEEPLGPLESTIKAIQKSIQEMDNEIETKQKHWVSNQSKLIKTIDETGVLEEAKRQIFAKLNILKQKRLRILQQIHLNDVGLKMVSSSIKSMHTDMSRLNYLIGKNTQTEMELSNDNSVKEMEFDSEVKDLEQESVQIEVKIEDVKNTKNQILKDIISVEEEILSLEKKIQLEKEIQATLNSSEELHETKGMQKEISRMKHRLDCMNRDQEKLIREMELAIHKKEDIAVKYQYAKNSDKVNSKSITVAELRKKRSLLMKQKSDIEKESSQVHQQLYMMEQKEKETMDKLTLTETKLKSLQENNKKLQHGVNFELFEKQRLMAKLSRKESLLKKYFSLESEEIKTVDYHSDQVAVEKRLAMAQDKSKRIKNAIEGLRLTHENYDEVFHRVVILLEDE